MTRRQVVIGALALAGWLVVSNDAMAQLRGGGGGGSGRSFGSRSGGSLFRSRGDNNYNNNNFNNNDSTRRSSSPAIGKDESRSAGIDSNRSLDSKLAGESKQLGDSKQSSQSIDKKDIALKGGAARPPMKLLFSPGRRELTDEDRAKEKLTLARGLFARQGTRENGIRVLKEIASAFPNTNAAVEAKKLLAGAR